MSIITVSRMFGSGGSDIAQRIARRLGFTLLDNSFIDSVAERLGIPASEVESREERVPNLVQRFADALALASPELLPPATVATLPPSEERMVEVTQRVIDEAVARGRVVLVGRGAQSVLATRPDVIHVFCYAPKPALALRVAARMNISLKEAEGLTEETNHQREQYVRKYWKRSWRAHENYHVCLNTEWLGCAACSDIVVRLAIARFGVQPVTDEPEPPDDAHTRGKHSESGPFTL